MSYTLKPVRYRDFEGVQLSNDSISLLVTKSVGPRLLKFRFRDRENILADLPDTTLNCPGVGLFYLWGGHRLWHAPEVPARTYIPDQEPVTVIEVEQGVQVIQEIEELTRLQKSMRIHLVADDPTLIVDHTLTNHGLESVECAPWAITQLRPGGVAILPHPTSEVDPDGVQPNRSIVLWPYTDINSSFINWGNHVTLLKAEMENGALKIGFPNPRGWLAYQWKDTLFVKKAEYMPSEDYFDHNASSQCYSNPEFLELETLGPRAQITPGESVTHREVWEMHMIESSDSDTRDLTTLTSRFDLDKRSPKFDLEFI
jgi:hypothetical protein